MQNILVPLRKVKSRKKDMKKTMEGKKVASSIYFQFQSLDVED